VLAVERPGELEHDTADRRAIHQDTEWLFIRHAQGSSSFAVFASKFTSFP